jgi:ribosomal protein L7/L12
MEPAEYFQAYSGYYWQWEEDSEVIAIPGGSTIAYRAYVMDVLDKLAPQGVPPFGALLLAIIATNPSANTSLDMVYGIVSDALTTRDNIEVAGAISFLRMLSSVPMEYKEGEKRLLLFQAIFENCHKIVSVRDSKKIRNYFHSKKQLFENTLLIQENLHIITYRDIKTITALGSRFSSTEEIIEKIASLPQLPEEIVIPERNDNVETDSKDLIDQLSENHTTFRVGSLIKRIWSGLNIPVHSVLPSQQPLGGVSDLTNKGDLDKLLISEFANDDLVFMSRLANNEALYMHREIPPINNNLQRVILIDVSLKSWGTPKTISFATMLAIARHPKTDIECTAFVIGNSFHPVSIENIDTIIEGLQILEGSLNAANGLAAFFKEFPPDKNREIFLITESSALKQSAMLRAVSDYQSAIHYWIETDAEGHIDLYKKQKNSRKHVQHMQLPLQELWKKAPAPKQITPANPEVTNDYPILFRNSLHVKKMFSTSDGEIFQVTGERALLRLFDKSAEQNTKGWELMYENLPVGSGEFEIGLLKNGEYVLLMFNTPEREINLLNVTTGSLKKVVHKEWTSTYPGFAFHDDKFFNGAPSRPWSIDTDGVIYTKYSVDHLLGHKRIIESGELLQKYSGNVGIYKNVKEIFINHNFNLMFHLHELELSHDHIRLSHRRSSQRKQTATKVSEKEFAFSDGSSIEVNRCGMLILKSSNPEIPFIYVPSVLGASLGVATSGAFAGNKYYAKNSLFTVILQDPGPNKLNAIRLLQETAHVSLHDAKTAADNAPAQILDFCAQEKALHIQQTLQKEGAQVSLKAAGNNTWNNVNTEIMTPAGFFKKYINAFVLNILAHGT